MPGPLPSPDRRRRNAPTIPTTNLPAAGRSGPPPKVPAWVDLGRVGKAWWRWAWSTPHAAAWSDGDLALVARRAELEDDAALTARVDSLDVLDIHGADVDEVRRLIRSLAGQVSGKMALFREMREIDDRLGLSPKGMAALRWKIVADEASVVAPEAASGVSSLDDRRRRLAAGAS